jgi:hypothetical protein
MSVLALLLLATSVSATSAGSAPAKWPVWYEGQEIMALVGPSSNSHNPNQLPNLCWGSGSGPNFTDNQDYDGMPIVYVLLTTGATQMYCNIEGLEWLTHDMVLTAAPGDLGYRPFMAFIYCWEGAYFDAAAMPYTSAAAVEAARDAGALECYAEPHGAVQLAPIVR